MTHRVTVWMVTARIDPQRRAKYVKLRYEDGLQRSPAARQAGVSLSWAKSYDTGMKDTGRAWKERRIEEKLPGPLHRSELKPEALAALDDFGLFRRRYFGRMATPWQEEAAYRTVEFLDTPHKEFVVVNCPPGSGKSTLFTHDIPAWLTCRDRSIRGLIGSRTGNQAEAYTARLKRTFERVTPMQAKDAEKQAGIGFDAEAVLVSDFGRFKPTTTEMWTRGAFVVEQFGETPIDEKEATWTAFGMDSGSLGWRVNLVVWDDVVDKTTIRTVEATEKQQGWWDDEAETRLEPGGLLVLQGQRMAASDLYRYCLNKPAGYEDAEDDDDPVPFGQQYHHIVFKAHYPDRCAKQHRPDEAKPYPEGCLLDPYRLPWRDLRAKMVNRDKFAVVYQQEDVDPANVLVETAWVDGGVDSQGQYRTGCLDFERGLAQIPQGLSGQVLSVVTADPSPTKFWSIQWWAVHFDTGQRFLLDLVRQRMDAPDFLERTQSGVYTGLLEEWWQRSKDMRHPITLAIVENNAAQRWLLQYQFVKDWQRERRCEVLPHATHRNKTDADYGVQSIAGVWRDGLVRLPWKPHNPGRFASMKLIDEVKRWPEGQTDDCVMAQWFLEYNLPKRKPRDLTPRRQKVPDWLLRGGPLLGHRQPA